MENSIEILKHNIAGELASLYVSYLGKMSMGHGVSYDYYKKNWQSEYKSRITLMTKNESLIETLNGYNDFFKANINQSSEVKRKFYLQ